MRLTRALRLNSKCGEKLKTLKSSVERQSWWLFSVGLSLQVNFHVINVATELLLWTEERKLAQSGAADHQDILFNQQHQLQLNQQ